MRVQSEDTAPRLSLIRVYNSVVIFVPQITVTSSRGAERQQEALVNDLGEPNTRRNTELFKLVNSLYAEENAQKRRLQRGMPPGTKHWDGMHLCKPEGFWIGPAP